jgi:Bacterial aa3 type cytochrome c oxidase subunit IV
MDWQTQGSAMAGNGDLKAHEQTYGKVMNVLKWATVATAIITLIVVLLIAS